MTCSTQDLPFVPNMTPDAWDRFSARDRGGALSVSLYGEGLEAIRAPSHGPPDRFMAFREFLGWPRVVPIEQRLDNLRVVRQPEGPVDRGRPAGGAIRSGYGTSLDSPVLTWCRLCRCLIRRRVGSALMSMPLLTQSVFCAPSGPIPPSTRLEDLRAKSGKDFVDGSRGYIDAVSGGRQKSVSMQLAQFVAAGYAALVPGLMGVGLAMGAWVASLACASARGRRCSASD